MVTPSVVHPHQININDYIFEVVSYVPLTNEQAYGVAEAFFLAHKFKKKDRKKVIFRIVTLVDERFLESQ